MFIPPRSEGAPGNEAKAEAIQFYERCDDELVFFFLVCWLVFLFWF